MKVLIINPPIGSVYSPPLGMICLKSFLEEKGIETIQWDISIDYIHHLLNPKRLNDIINGANSILNIEIPKNVFNKIQNIRIKFDEGPIDSFVQLQPEIILSYLYENWTEESININPDQNYEDQLSLINDGLILSSFQYYPNIVYIGSPNWQENLLMDTNCNPFIDFYKNKIIPEIKKINPDIIGISYSYDQQIIPGISLVSEIKKAGINAQIVVGGSCFSTYCAHAVELNGRKILLSNENQVPKIIHAVRYMLGHGIFGIYGEGENALLELCRRIEKQVSLKDISGLVHVDKMNVMHFNKPVDQINFKKHSELSLDNLPIHKKYLTPVPIAPIHSSRGCYWRKCTFCDHAEVLCSNFREMDIENLMKSIINYYNKYGISLFFFCDESMSPSMLKKISEEVISSNIDIQFGTMIRIEKCLDKILPIASKAGLKFLSFGLESASDRILNKMDKGFKINDALKIFNICYENNILLHYNIIFGFPTESHEEALTTLNFLFKNADKMLCVRVNNWMLSPGSIIMKNPDQFGVSLLKDINNLDSSSYELKEGISSNEAQNYINEIYNHNLLIKKIIYNGRIEEFHLINSL